MKKIFSFLVFSLMVLALVACGKTEENNPKEVAEEFIVKLHTVDEEKIKDYREFEEMEPSGADVIGEDVPEETKTDYNQEYVDMLDSLDGDIKNLMAEEGYEKLSKNRFNLASTRVCARNNCSSEVTGVSFGEDEYEDYEGVDTLRYSYQADIKFHSIDGDDESEGVIKGNIELLEEDGEWKVLSYDISSYPEQQKPLLGKFLP